MRERRNGRINKGRRGRRGVGVVRSFRLYLKAIFCSIMAKTRFGEMIIRFRSQMTIQFCSNCSVLTDKYSTRLAFIETLI